MKYLPILMLLVGGAAVSACTNTDESSAYEVQDTEKVTLAVSGMT